MRKLLLYKERKFVNNSMNIVHFGNFSHSILLKFMPIFFKQFLKLWYKQLFYTTKEA